MRKLLLISSSRTHGTGFLEHCLPAIEQHLSGAAHILFIPYALADRDRYAQIASAPFTQLGIGLYSIHQEADPVAAIHKADSIFIGGGNSFRLLKTLYDLNLLDPIRAAVAEGKPYMGSSAGTNMACPTIRTTNDMPIVQPPSFDALNLIPFQINPHYLDPDPNSKHRGETREQRIREYHEENESPVAGIREGCWLEVSGDQCLLQGSRPMRLFRRGDEPTEIDSGTDVSFLME